MGRFVKIFSTLLALLLALAVIPVSGSETESPREQAPDTVTVVLAACDIPAGTRISDKHLSSVVMKKVNLPDNIISDPVEIVGQYLGERMSEGEYFRQDALFKKQVAIIDSDLLLAELKTSKNKYVAVTDYVKADTGKDVTGILQSIIDENPQRTIYFPDGEYIISQPLLTSGLDEKRVCLYLSDGAVIRASEDFKSVGGSSALICMGAADLSNSGNSIISGGVLDCGGRADGISIDSCLDSYVYNVCIIDPKTGIDVKLGIHNKSSCWDITNVTVIGSGTVGSVGMNVDGYDNTVTDVRIYNMHTGLRVTGAGNFFRNIYVVNDAEDGIFYDDNRGVDDRANNWYGSCYTENCAVAYTAQSNTLFFDNSAVWTDGRCERQTALKLSGGIIPVIGFKALFFGESAATALIELSSDIAPAGALFGCMANEKLIDGKEYADHKESEIIPLG